MRELLEELLRRRRDRQPVAFCRVVETRGSTPQKAGAAMLLFPDGSQRGTLGGGCVEAEVKRRALKNLADGAAEVFTFNLDDDYGWDDGLICGGRMQVLVEPLADDESLAYFTRLAECLDAAGGCTEAVVFEGEKCGLAAPSTYLFDAEEQLLASHRADTSDAALAIVRQKMKPLADRPRAYAAQGISYLPVLPRCRLVIVGGGHVGQAVGNLAVDLDFDVWVVDDREQYIAPDRFPRAERRICGPIGQVLPELEITSDTYCLIVTRGHNHDEEALFHLADRGARYVGMIGSKRKIKLIFEDLEERGVSRDVLSKVFAPLGINIGSQTVPEIAVSILAELIAHRNLGGEVPGRETNVLLA